MFNVKCSQLFIILLYCFISVLCKNAWEKPGCHHVGITRKITIPNCVEFRMTLNACRGFCQSYAVPSIPRGIPSKIFENQPISSFGRCCNIEDTKDVNVTVGCIDGPRNVTFKSAVSCNCMDCGHD